MEQIFRTTTSKPLNTSNPDKYTNVYEDSYKYPKKPAKPSKLKDRRKTSIDTTNRFSVLSPDERPTDEMLKDSSLDGTRERIIKIDENNSNHRTASYKNTYEIPRKNKLPVTFILRNSVVKDVKGWNLSDDGG